MRKLLTLFSLFFMSCESLAFRPTMFENGVVKPFDITASTAVKRVPTTAGKPNNKNIVDDLMTNTAAATAVIMASCIPTNAMAAADLEVADLPSPYIPAVFGVLILIGIGWLTSSLSSVMDEEAALGLQSGARAKKEMERSRSSYFKKK